ncbi:hypothetical protein COOONC_15434 [Cooperia oncophora]
MRDSHVSSTTSHHEIAIAHNHASFAESYSVTASTAKWPSTAHTPQECQKNNTGAAWNTPGVSCGEWYRKNTLLVEIYYERMNFQVLTESPAYTLVNMVSDAGGQVGLFLGMSIISVIEYLALILLLLCYCATHKSRKREIAEIEKETHNAKVRLTQISSREAQWNSEAKRGSFTLFAQHDYSKK